MKVRLLAACVLVALVAVVVPGLVACGGSAPDEALPLQGTTLKGETFDLARQTPKPTVVNFFASRCPPCNQEAPDLVKTAKAHPEVRFVGVANEGQDGAQQFASQYGLPYDVVLDASGEIAAAWGVDLIPATFFLDENGVQVDAIVGAATQEQFEEKLKSIQ